MVNNATNVEWCVSYKPLIYSLYENPQKRSVNIENKNSIVL